MDFITPLFSAYSSSNKLKQMYGGQFLSGNLRTHKGTFNIPVYKYGHQDPFCGSHNQRMIKTGL